MPIVAAVGAAVAHGATGPEGARLQRIQQAMTAAAEQAHAEGLTDPELVRERLRAARDKALAEG